MHILGFLQFTPVIKRPFFASVQLDQSSLDITNNDASDQAVNMPMLILGSAVYTSSNYGLCLASQSCRT